MGIKTFEYTFCKTFLEQKNVFNLTVTGIDLLEENAIDNKTRVGHLNYLLTI